MGEQLTPLRELPEALVEYNRARYREELSQAVFDLMGTRGVTTEGLGKLLDFNPNAVRGVMGGGADFECDTVADIFLVLGRAPHVILGVDLEELRSTVDEGAPIE